MNPNKGKDEKKPGACGSPGSAGGKTGGGALGAGGKSEGGKSEGGKSEGGKEESGKAGGAMASAGGAMASAGGGGKDSSCDDGKCKELKKIFEESFKSEGLSKEDAKKWLKNAGVCDEKTGCSEKDFDQAFDKASKGQKTIDFDCFKGIIECISKEKKKEPKEFFEKLVSAGPPK